MACPTCSKDDPGDASTGYYGADYCSPACEDSALPERINPMNIEITVHPCPSTPLNLRLGVIYEPRVATPPFNAYRAVETSPGRFQVESFGDNGYVSVARVGSLAEAWHRLAASLRMDA